MASARKRRLDITEADLVRIETLGRELNEITNGKALRVRIMRGLNELFPAWVFGLNEVDVGAKHARVLQWPQRPAVADLSERVARFLDKHPIVQHYLHSGDSLPTRLSDHTSALAWQNSPVRGEVFRPIGAWHQMVIPLFDGALGGRGDGYAINRTQHGDFSDRELDIARVLKPVLIAHHQRLPSWSDESITAAQAEALRLVLRGLSLTEIAEELRCSRSAVVQRISGARGRLAVQSRKAIAVALRAHELGLLG